MLRIFLQVLGHVGFRSSSGDLLLNFIGHIGYELLGKFFGRVIVALLTVVVLNLDNNYLRFPRLGDIEELVSVVATECKDLVL